MLTPGWYLTSDTGGHHHVLMSGVQLNSLNTWDVTKLGWVKQGPGHTLVSPNIASLSRYFVPSVGDCAGGEYTGHFSNIAQINKNSVEGRDVKQDFSFISRVRVWSRHVEVSVNLSHLSIFSIDQSQLSIFSIDHSQLSIAG